MSQFTKGWEGLALNQFALHIRDLICVCGGVWLIPAKWPLLEGLVPVGCRPYLVPSGHNVKFHWWMGATTTKSPIPPFPFAFQGQGQALSAALNTAWKPKYVVSSESHWVREHLLSRDFEPKTGPPTTSKHFHCLLQGPHPLTDLIQCKHMQPEPAYSVLLLDSANLAIGLRLLLPFCPSVF